MYMRLWKSCHDLEELSFFAQLTVGLAVVTAMHQILIVLQYELS
jgi:hypothetical protein